MKNLVLIILVAVAVGAGYFFITKPAEELVLTSSANEITTAPINSDTMSVAEVETAATEDNAAEESMITPADMPEEAQDEMYGLIGQYNQCMMQNRLEYHQQGAQVVNVADKTLAACEPKLDLLKELLESQNVNRGLAKKMVYTMRSRAARKLMAAVVQSMAGQAAAANAAPE